VILNQFRFFRLPSSAKAFGVPPSGAMHLFEALGLKAELQTDFGARLPDDNHERSERSAMIPANFLKVFS
jgi:hypothetical protein